jgi:two-component system nitrate/nitrite response regulator NarL
MTTPSPEQPRILIIEDHLLVRAGLGMLIEDLGMKVVGMAGNRAEALEVAAREKPDVILLDLSLGGEDSLSFLPELREAAKNARVLILTGTSDPEPHRRAIRLGAMGVVLKGQAPAILIKAIQKVYAGEVWIDRATMGNLLQEMTQKNADNNGDHEKIKSLTQREHQVIALIAEGLKNKEIGARLFISETTVTHHLSSIFSKLEVSDRLELVIYAFGHNLARLPQ